VILITGGAGFIGSKLANRLSDEGKNVRVLDNLSKQIHGSEPFNSPLYLSLNSNIDFQLGSVSDYDDIKKALNGVTTLVHLAAETGTGQSMYEMTNYVDTNIVGTTKLLETIKNENYQIRKIILASSRAVYGEGKYLCIKHGNQYPKSRSSRRMNEGIFDFNCQMCQEFLKPLATDEESIANPTSIYGITKLTQEKIVHLFACSNNIDSYVFRFQNVYGPGQSLANPYTGILSIFSTRILSGNQIEIFEDGEESRDFVYVDDVVEYLIRSINNESPKNSILNIGSGISTKVIDIAKLLRSCYQGSSELIISGKYRVGDIRHNFSDNSKLEQELGKIQFKGIEEGLQLFKNWVLESEIPEDKYDESLSELRSRGLLG
jgi:dTDP-L-rhamnose 4-epimerase